MFNKSTYLLLLLIVGCSGGGGADSTSQNDSRPDGTQSDIRVEVSGLDSRRPDAGGQDLGDRELARDLREDRLDAPMDTVCPSGSGCSLEPCMEDDDCLSGLCTPHLGELVCAGTCGEGCPEGWACNQGEGSCLSEAPLLGVPCISDSDCVFGAALISALCISYGPQGSFCGAGCDDDCPSGFSCQVPTFREDAGRQCLADSGDPGCSSFAVSQGSQGACYLENSFGTCHGSWTCGPNGPGECSAPEPGEDLCNGLDDDCDGQIDEIPCDDGDPCTQDSCSGQVCTFTPISGEACDDGDPCTTNDACISGVCSGAVLNCQDDNPCTDDSCLDGQCLFQPNSAACDDDEPCTTGDVCTEGTCVGTPVDCTCHQDQDCLALEDGNLCNGILFCDLTALPYLCAVDSGSVVTCPGPDPTSPDAPCLAPACDPVSAACSLAPVNEGGACDDGNLCTLGDYCLGGICTAAVSQDCDDDNLCTDDFCDPSEGCLHLDNTAACSDNDLCTEGDSCNQGACISGQAVACDDDNPCTDDSCDPLVGCSNLPNQLDCDDQNECTVDDVCGDGTCLGTARICDDGNSCTDDTCDTTFGCFFTGNTEPCDDENACTLGDICAAGLCSGAELQCDDGNPCTDDSCDPLTGCVNQNNSRPCDDHNACTTEDVCVEGSCLGAPATCGDENSCTDDSCEPDVGCVFTPNQAACDDGDLCTSGDLCDQGQCKGPEPVNCDDGNPCTTDSCEPDSGCGNSPNTLPCNDGDLCTGPDLCSSGVCSGAAVDCDDGNPCTDDSCDPGQGCLHAFNSAGCDDLNACTTTDTCAEGSCHGSGSLSCNDNNPCTTDSCDPSSGCTYTPNTLACNDSDPCTLGDSCVLGECRGGTALGCDDGNPCTDDSCLPETGCRHQFNTNACDDHSLCTADDVCSQGVCSGTGNLDCDDHNPCTIDICEAGNGCSYQNTEGACDDGNPCTSGDFCSEGSCLAGQPVTCDDSNPCTEDSCNLLGNCIHEPGGSSCDDGSLCTLGDSCVDGSCVSGPAADCDDNNICTSDSCNPSVGCVHVNNIVTCNDGNACTLNDRCTDGACAGQSELDCDDANPCTDDSCAPETGCIHLENTLPCDDQNLCTEQDLCVQGACRPGSPRVCDDGNSCTSDTCTPQHGCSFISDDSLECDDLDPCTVTACSEGVCTVSATWECGLGCGDCESNQICLEHQCISTFGNSCESPIYVNDLPFSHIGNTSDASDNFQAPATACDGATSSLGEGARDQVFYWEAPYYSTFTFEVTSMFDSVVYLFSDCSDIPATCLAGADPSRSTLIELPMEKGDQVFLVVDGVNGAEPPFGAYSVRITGGCIPTACSGTTCGSDGCTRTCQCSEGGICQSDQYCCFPNCEGRDCGPDGCGGSCGDCGDLGFCRTDGHCCTPDCEGKNCGPDGCGGSCGTCEAGFDCQDGVCCTPSCDGIHCLDDGCGNLCSCPEGQGCSEDGLCCDSTCGNRNCGPDEGCGGTCGTCDEDQICTIWGLCCTPDCGTKECGTDLCGVSCGTCPEGSVCRGDMCCVPDCDGKECGSDGCGGSCGVCPGGAPCLSDQTCCVPICDGRECGTNGCGGSCGSCESGSSCIDGLCCDPVCDGLDCGDNGCGGVCGTCGENQYCSQEQQCCLDCSLRQCGDDGCGNSCGTCGEGQVCRLGACCTPQCDGGLCGGDDGCGGSCGDCGGWPAYCTSEGVCGCWPDCSLNECGDDGCGGSCGECSGTNRQCVEGRCLCTPDCTGLECGDDGCGGSCGTCDSGVCLEGTCCQPACPGVECGDDGCGGSCGDCPGQQEVCADGSCVCIPDCQGRLCGDDGCGGSCGACGPFQVCLETGECCSTGCDALECGPGACLADCGSCPQGQTCLLGECCEPSCEGVQCGDDGCGGSCGTCMYDNDLCVGGLCSCTPDCTGRLCGDDGCGGSCGECAIGELCADGECFLPDCEDTVELSCGSQVTVPCVSNHKPLPFVISDQDMRVALTLDVNGCDFYMDAAIARGYCTDEALIDTIYRDYIVDSLTTKTLVFDTLANVPYYLLYRQDSLDVHYCPNNSRVTLSVACTPTCTPDCSGGVCGDDGCGGICDSCAEGWSCYQGMCCRTTCSSLNQCGDDGCGGLCPSVDELWVDGSSSMDPRGRCGDATRPFSTISQALDAAAPGAVIHVLPGVYEENLSISKEGISLIGTSEETVTILGNGRHGSLPPGSQGIVNISAGEVTLEGLSVRHGPTGVAANQASGLTLRNLSISDCMTGIRIAGSDNALVQLVSIEGIDVTGGVEASSAPVSNLGIDLYYSDSVVVDMVDLSNLSGDHAECSCVYRWIYEEPSGGSATGIRVNHCDELSLSSITIDNLTGGDGIDECCDEWGSAGGCATGVSLANSEGTEIHGVEVSNLTGGTHGTADCTLQQCGPHFGDPCASQFSISANREEECPLDVQDEDRECGYDQCGYWEACPEGESCEEGHCVPVVLGNPCGAEGGHCMDGTYCDWDNVCRACSCEGKSCGDDGCGNSCGACADGQACYDYRCWVPACDEVGCSIPPGRFMMGCDHAATSECPASQLPYHEVYTSGFFMDRSPVTRAEYLDCVEEGVCPPQTMLTDRISALVSKAAAQTYCEWDGGRLCTEAEWEKAARSSDGRTYVTGETRITNPKCAYWSCPYYSFECAVGDDDAGTHPELDSPAGVGDMLFESEYVSDRYDPDYYARSTGINPQGSEDSTITQSTCRGGYSINVPPTSYYHSTYHRQSCNNAGRIVFRCCRNQ